MQCAWIYFMQFNKVQQHLNQSYKKDQNLGIKFPENLKTSQKIFSKV